MKLEVGMYVKTEDGLIAKLIEKEEDDYCFFDNSIYINFSEKFNNCYLNNIVIEKVSHNIIDLIEVGDYVNGNKIRYIYSEDELKALDIDEKRLIAGNNYQIRYIEKDIKSIVTKEQFEAMQYVIK